MERSAKHKGSSERALLTARAKIETLLGREEISGAARTELEEVTALIRSVELSVGQKRMSDMRLKSPSLDFLLQEGILEGTVQHRDQLVQLYTDCDMAAAEGNRAIAPRKTLPLSIDSSGTSLPGERLPKDTRRMSTQELDARVAEVLTRERAAELLMQAGTWNFDAIAFGDVVQQTIFVLFAAMEEKLRLIKQVRDLGQVGNAAVFHGKLMHFMEKINSLYQETNPYHSSVHAADVVVTVEWFFRTSWLQTHTSPLDHLVTLIGGAIHDVGHPGLQNLFLQKTLSPMAIRYNDKSILENMHISLSFEIMQNDLACNWYQLLPTAFRAPPPSGQQAEGAPPAVNLQQYVRKALVQMVLATDMGKHAKSVQDLKIFVEEQASPSQADESEQKHLALENKLLTLDTVLHAADISNPCKPKPIMLKWTKRVLREFWNQGDEEKRLDLPVSPLCDRETEQWAVPKGQLGFINFVVSPLYTPLSRLMPEVEECLEHLKASKAFWEEMNTAKATFDDIFADVS
mmetsp:Transcript_15441/g.49426  ORF Transcript_15441/g.49426 Transcript_15441/m.49426 type:complete len:517 (-) Transcript_15441:200-1750(-)